MVMVKTDELAEARSVIGERERELRVLKQVVQEKGEEGVVELKRVLRELKTELEEGRGREEGQRKVIERLKATLEEEAHRRALSHAEDSSARKKGRDGERERRAAVQMSERLQVRAHCQTTTMPWICPPPPDFHRPAVPSVAW